MAKIYNDSQDERCYLKTTYVEDGVEFMVADLDEITIIKLDFEEANKLIEGLAFILKLENKHNVQQRHRPS